MNIGNKLAVVKTAATSKAGLTLLRTQKHSPGILFVAGVVGFGATVVLASRATLKLSDLLDENENKQTEVHDLHEINKLQDVKQADKDYKKDLSALKVHFVKDVTLLYAPSVVVGVLSVGALTGSHVILNRRYTSVLAAYATLDKSFREYRSRVTDIYGAEVEKKLSHGVVTREIASEDGSTVSTVEGSAGGSPYARIFSKETSAEWSPQSDYNLVYLRAQETYANDLLKSRGYVFLNEIYKALGFESVPAGQSVGWLKNNPKMDHDGYIDFGIFDQPERFVEFMRGKEGAIWLDFNVDGPIWDLI